MSGLSSFRCTRSPVCVQDMRRTASDGACEYLLSTAGFLRLQEWMSALLNCLPAAQRARARLRMELNRMQARTRGMGWSQLALVASLAIMVRPLESSALMHVMSCADTLQALGLSYIASIASLALV